MVAFAVLALGVAVSMLLAGAQPAESKPVAGPVQATTLNSSEAEQYWTPERIADAPPLEVAEENGEVTLSTEEEPNADPFTSDADLLKSKEIRNTRRYPNRVHGKIVGTFPGIGDYSCSGTVISSKSKSLVSTAGHCVYDPGSRRFASRLIFVPGTRGDAAPYAFWGASNVITTGGWVRRASLAYDAAMLRMAPNNRGRIERVVGARGIGFNQPRKQKLTAYGYPAEGAPKYTGRRLISCRSGNVSDPNGRREGGPESRGMKCNMKGGSSGGGWVSQKTMVVSNVSHYHPDFAKNKIYGPYFGSAVKGLYKAKRMGYPSTGPLGCSGKVATMVGTSHRDKLVGTKGRDIIAAMGGKDKIKGKGGKDVICGGPGNDKLIGGGGRDKIDGGPGKDRCRGGGGKDRVRCGKKR